MSGPKVFLKACVNGVRTPDQHPALPVTPAQLAAEAAAAHRAGARAVHMHPKTPAGVDSLLPEAVDAAVAAVRRAAPGVPVGVTTGYWALPDAAARHTAVRAWSVLPDFASVNWHEPGSPELAELLRSRGIGVEAGIFDAAAAAAWAASDIAADCLRVMVELPPEADTAAADEILGLIRAAPRPVPILLHGADDSCWPLLEHAGRLGLQTRIGLEDTLRLPDGSVPAGNADLVTAAVRLLS